MRQPLDCLVATARRAPLTADETFGCQEHPQHNAGRLCRSGLALNLHQKLAPTSNVRNVSGYEPDDAMHELNHFTDQNISINKI